MLQFSTSLQLCYAGEKLFIRPQVGKAAKWPWSKNVFKNPLRRLRALTVRRFLVGDVKIREDIEKYCHVLCTIMQ
jgi:hypothetical protein